MILPFETKLSNKQLAERIPPMQHVISTGGLPSYAAIGIAMDGIIKLGARPSKTIMPTHYKRYFTEEYTSVCDGETFAVPGEPYRFDTAIERIPVVEDNSFGQNKVIIMADQVMKSFLITVTSGA